MPWLVIVGVLVIQRMYSTMETSSLLLKAAVIASRIWFWLNFSLETCFEFWYIATKDRGQRDHFSIPVAANVFSLNPSSFAISQVILEFPTVRRRLLFYQQLLHQSKRTVTFRLGPRKTTRRIHISSRKTIYWRDRGFFGERILLLAAPQHPALSAAPFASLPVKI